MYRSAAYFFKEVEEPNPLEELDAVALARLRDPARLQALADTGLLDEQPEAALDGLTRLATRLLGVPAAAVSLITAERQFLSSAVGLSPEVAAARETPLSQSFCKYVVSTREPLLINDASQDKTFKKHGAFVELGIHAYAGVPLICDSQSLGALCVADGRPRRWSEEDLENLKDLAAAAVSELKLRMKVAALKRAHEAQLHNERLLESVLDNMHDAVMVCDERGTIVLANEPARRGRPDAAMTNLESMAEYGVFLPDGTPCPPESFPPRRALAGETVTGAVMCTRLPEVGETWRSINSNAIRDEHGNITGVVSVARDITAFRRAEADRIRSEKLLRTVVDNLPNMAVMLFDRDLRCLLASGDRVLAAVGTSSDALLGRTVRETASPENVERVEQIYHRVLEGAVVEFEVSRAGLTFEVRAIPVRDVDNLITGCLALSYDVTARKRTEATLRRSELVAREHAERVELLQAVADAANFAENSAMAFNSCMALVAEHMKWSLGHAFTRRDDGLVTSGLWHDNHPKRFKEFRRATEALTFTGDVGLIGQVLSSGKPRWMLDLQAEDGYVRKEAAAGAQLVSGFAFPVLIRTEVVAVLEFYSEQSMPPDPALLEVMGHVGVQLGRVLERDRTRLLLEEHAQRLSALSLRDELTGLYNRRGFMELARQQIRFVERNKRPVALIFVDLDGMKTINDNLGHEQGDRAIQETAQLLKKTFRASDIIARLGGDEFVVLTIDTDAERADAVRQRTRAAVDDWNAQGVAPFQLSLSLGTAQHENGETIEDLLTRADAEMYQQKRARPGSRESR